MGGAVRWPGGPATPCGSPACRCPACHRPGHSGSAPLTVTGIAAVRTRGRAAAPVVTTLAGFSGLSSPPAGSEELRGGGGCGYRQTGPPWGCRDPSVAQPIRCRRRSRWVTPAEGAEAPGPLTGGARRGRCCRVPGRPEAPAEQEPPPPRPAAGLLGAARTRSDASIGREEEEQSRDLLSADLLVLRTMDSLRASQV